MTADDALVPDEGYTGPATLRAPDRELAVQAALSGRFDPNDGRYHWSGRLTATALAELWRALGGPTDVVLVGPGGLTANGRLRELDPWQNLRVVGQGRPPFPVPDEH
jgi:uncharacterized protein DUF4873